MKYVYQGYFDDFRRRLEMARKHRDVLYIVLDDGAEWDEFVHEMDSVSGPVCHSAPYVGDMRFDGVDVIPAWMEPAYREAHDLDN